MKKILITSFLIATLLIFNAGAGTDGEMSISKKNSAKEIKECFEGINRVIFKVNQVLDRSLFKPIAKGYRKLPNPIKSGTGNALNNLSHLVTVPNNILQGEFKDAGTNTIRFIVNTTAGVLGVFDVAATIGFENLDKEDYGQTLATWGVGPGCYIVIPVLGPSTLRDTISSFGSLAVNLDPWYNVSVARDTHHFSDFDYYASRGTKALDFRAKNIDSFENLEKNSMDFYASVKSLYIQDRKQKILNSKLSTIETQDDSDWEEIESK